MIRSTLFFVVGFWAIFSFLFVPASHGATDEPETKEQRDARMQWWREARFGMFIHWGVYSVPAGTYHGQQSQHIGEWIMHDFRNPLR